VHNECVVAEDLKMQHSEMPLDRDSISTIMQRSRNKGLREHLVWRHRLCHPLVVVS